MWSTKFLGLGRPPPRFYSTLHPAVSCSPPCNLTAPACRLLEHKLHPVQGAWKSPSSSHAHLVQFQPARDPDPLTHPAPVSLPVCHKNVRLFIPNTSDACVHTQALPQAPTSKCQLRLQGSNREFLPSKSAGDTNWRWTFLMMSQAGSDTNGHPPPTHRS